MEESPAQAGTGCFCLIPALCPASHMQLPVVQRSLLRCKPPSSNCEEFLKSPCSSPCWLLEEHHSVWRGRSWVSGCSPPSLFTIMPAAADQANKWGSQVPSWHSCHVTRTAGIATTCLSSFLQGTTRTKSGNSFPQHSQHTLCPWGTRPRTE